MADKSELQQIRSSKFESKGQNCESEDREPISQKLVREAYLIGESLAQGVDEGWKEAKEDPVGTAARVGTAAAATLVLTKAAGASRCFSELTTAVNVGLSTSALFDLAQSDRVSRIGDVLSDAWASESNLCKDVSILKMELGRFAFDSLLTTVAGSLVTTPASFMRTHNGLQSMAYKPCTKGEVTYMFGNGITYKVSADQGVLRSGALSVTHTPHGKTPSFTYGKTLDGKDVARFFNGDKIINEHWWRTTIEAGKPGDKRLQIRYHQPDITINESQTSGKWNNRSLSYQDWLGVRELRDGTLKISAQGNPRGTFEPPDLSQRPLEFLKTHMRVPNLTSPLPHRPKVTDLHGEGHVVEFASGAKLVVDGSDTALLRSGNSTTLIHRELLNDNVSTRVWRHLVNSNRADKHE